GGTVPRWALAEGFSVEADLLNPVTSLLNTRQNNPGNNFFSNSKIVINPIDGLEFRSDFSFTANTYRGERFTGRFTAPGRTIDQNFRSINNELYYNWNWENIGSYNFDLNEAHF